LDEGIPCCETIGQRNIASLISSRLVFGAVLVAW
jgi:hypothetical protein